METFLHASSYSHHTNVMGWESFSYPSLTLSHGMRGNSEGPRSVSSPAPSPPPRDLLTERYVTALSDLGRKGYRSYWTSVVASSILAKECEGLFTITELSEETWIHHDDVIATLKRMNAICKSDSAAGGWVVSKSRVKEYITGMGVKAGGGNTFRDLSRGLGSAGDNQWCTESRDTVLLRP